MLEGKTNYIRTFKNLWYQANSWGKLVDIFDNPNIVYGYADFDEWLLKDAADLQQLCDWRDELGLIEPDPIKLYKTIASKKRSSYVQPTATEMKYFNRAAWLSMERKGEILIKAFKDQFYPQITKVVSTQKRSTITDPQSGDSIMGVIDMVLELKGYDKPIIFDLKTAARAYTEENIELTDQLTLYRAMEGDNYGTNLVGYVVLVKNIEKDSSGFCTVCNHQKNGRHRTCDNIISGKRCSGEWKETKIPNPKVQVLVKEKTQEQVNALLEDISNIVVAMKNNVVWKNTDKCNNWYGSRCVYYSACHNNDTSGLVNK